eukprot:gene6356-1194_t
MACTQRVREEVGRNASLLADGALVGMQLNALRPRGAALLGGRHVMAGPHHPYTACQYTSLERHKLLRDFATALTRLSGTDVFTESTARPVVATGRTTEHDRPGPVRPAHAIVWRGHRIFLLSPEQWAAVPQDTHLQLLSVGAVWRERAADFYAEGG